MISIMRIPGCLRIVSSGGWVFSGGVGSLSWMSSILGDRGAKNQGGAVIRSGSLVVG